MAGLQTIYIVVRDESTGICSYTWRIWWHGSSFYLKARDAAFAGFKVSFHGPDAFHREPGFIVGRDQSAGPVEGTAVLDRQRFFGSRFEGESVGNGALHVATLRFGADLFKPGAPSAPFPTGVRDRPSNAARIAVAPGDGEVTDVRVFVGYGKPFIPDEERARREDAVLGPLRNARDEYLTAVVYKNRARLQGGDSQRHALAPRDAADSVRGFSGTIDPVGDFLWIEERLLSRARMIGHDDGVPV